MSRVIESIIEIFLCARRDTKLNLSESVYLARLIEYETHVRVTGNYDFWKRKKTFCGDLM